MWGGGGQGEVIVTLMLIRLSFLSLFCACVLSVLRALYHTGISARFPEEIRLRRSHTMLSIFHFPTSVQLLQILVRTTPLRCRPTFNLHTHAGFLSVPFSSVRQYLTNEAAKTLVVSFVLSRSDNGKCLLAGVPDCL